MKIEYFWAGPAEFSYLDTHLDLTESAYDRSLAIWENHVVKPYAETVFTVFNYMDELISGL